MYYVIQYLTHLITATNQHGVHSPFVYKYITKCLYSKERYSKKKTIDVLLKSITYFEVKTVSLQEKESLQPIIQQKFPNIILQGQSPELLFVCASQQKSIEALFSLPHTIHNNSILLVDNIHQRKSHQKIWQLLKGHDSVTVTIDLFYCGVVFFRAGQAKEHFKIRI